MKRRDLIKRLEGTGFEFTSHGGNHDTYKRGTDIEQIPRHREIDENLAKHIIRKRGAEIVPSWIMGMSGNNLLTCR